MKKSLMVLMSASLAGCATFGHLEDGLKLLMGQNSQTAFNVLGYPSAKQKFGSDTVYYWSFNRSGTLIVPQTSTTTGYVGNKPVYGTTTSNQLVPVNYNCQIKLVAGPNDVLKSWEYEGNIGGCQSYVGRLKSFTSQIKTPRPKLTK